ncbi:MAG: NUDIX domain-containing protein [Bifidobacteriaceae bacterium]|nr:NUDIX domain-containing protein [Bifidobacteriaceae bacterium]
MFEAPVNQRLAAVIGAHLAKAADPSHRPVEPRCAATVMLVRDRPIEVFMLRRASTMAFAPDAVVFPGGRVDPRDADPDLPWAGPSPAQWARRMGCDEATARQVVVAAARELFEETGILLAADAADAAASGFARPGGPGGPDGPSGIGGPDGPGASGGCGGPGGRGGRSWRRDRQRLARHEECLAEILRRRGLVLRTDRLGLRARWLTPEFEPRRYDTFFFAVLAPPDQEPDAETLEAVGGAWERPERLIEQGRADQILLMPPTAHNLAQLAGAASAAAFVDENPPARQIMLTPKIKDDGQVVLTCVLP